MTAPAHYDQKEALTSARKPDVTHARTPLLVYNARACEYGCAKGYDRGNFLRRTATTSEDFKRLRAYLAAGLRHIMATLDQIERHQANDPHLVDIEGMKRAAYAPDTDPDPTGTVGPSGLPHLCGAAASLNMALAQAVDAGLLPADPGQPWREQPSQLDFTHAAITINVGGAVLSAEPREHQTADTCVRGAGGTCITHNVPLDRRHEHGDAWRCRLTQREVA